MLSEQFVETITIIAKSSKIKFKMNTILDSFLEVLKIFNSNRLSAETLIINTKDFETFKKEAEKQSVTIIPMTVFGGVSTPVIKAAKGPTLPDAFTGAYHVAGLTLEVHKDVPEGILYFCTHRNYVGRPNSAFKVKLI